MLRNFEEDIKTLFLEQIKNNDEFCKELWSALTNIEWINNDGSYFYCTFRYAGALIADIRESGGYMDWYCSSEYAKVSEYIEEKLNSLGWKYTLLK